MQVAINLPSDFIEMQTASVIEREMRSSYALTLFKAERVTLSKAAELAGVTIYEFIKLCKVNKIPIIDMNKEELLQELESMRLT
jgi:predicted HTH domain antitoxin